MVREHQTFRGLGSLVTYERFEFQFTTACQLIAERMRLDVEIHYPSLQSIHKIYIDRFYACIRRLYPARNAFYRQVIVELCNTCLIASRLSHNGPNQRLVIYRQSGDRTDNIIDLEQRIVCEYSDEVTAVVFSAIIYSLDSQYRLSAGPECNVQVSRILAAVKKLRAAAKLGQVSELTRKQFLRLLFAS